MGSSDVKPGVLTSLMPFHVFILIGTNKVELTYNITDHVIMDPVSIKFRIHVLMKLEICIQKTLIL